jgi:hypothetical protein
MGAVLLSIGVGIFSFGLGIQVCSKLIKKILTEAVRNGQAPYIGENGSLMWRKSFSRSDSKIEVFPSHENDSQAA